MDARRLADRIALAVLADGPASCEVLARTVKARTADVLAALNTDPRFEHRGRGRASTWTLRFEPFEPSREGMGRILSADSNLDAVPDARLRLRALERRVAILELRLAEWETPNP